MRSIWVITTAILWLCAPTVVSAQEQMKPAVKLSPSRETNTIYIPSIALIGQSSRPTIIGHLITVRPIIAHPSIIDRRIA